MSESAVAPSEIQIHHEKGPIRHYNDRLINHVTLSPKYDFIPQAIVADNQSSLPVQKIEGSTIKDFVSNRNIPGQEKVTVLLETAKQFKQLAEDGIYIWDRNGGNLIVDQNRKVWQVDLEGVRDLVTNQIINSKNKVDLNDLNRAERLKEQDVQDRIARTKRDYVSELMMWTTYLPIINHQEFAHQNLAIFQEIDLPSKFPLLETCISNLEQLVKKEVIKSNLIARFRQLIRRRAVKPKVG